MRPANAVAVLLVTLAATSLWLPIVSALPPLENGLSFPAGTFVIPMDGTQAERILVFGFVHALTRAPNPIQIFRVIEPPDVTLSTNMTASPKVFTGGPFLVYPSDAAKIAQVRNKPAFVHVTVGVLTTQHVLNNIFRIREPTEILVVKGVPAWGRTDLTLDAMDIPYNITTHAALIANPNMIFSFSLIVIDCAGWNGFIPSQIASNIRTHVDAGNEVIFTDRALLDLNSTFPGYVNLSIAQPTDRIADTYVYSPPRKYDLTKYGASADRFEPEFPSQYYNPPTRPYQARVFTESFGYAVSSIPASGVNDVRILADTKTFGASGNQYAILAFYFQYGRGIVEGLAFHPQQQVKSTVGDNGYYAVYQFYGNKFVHGPPPSGYTLGVTPLSASTPQGGSAGFTIAVNSYGFFNSPVSLGLTGLPAGSTYAFSPPAPQPSAGGTATSALTVTVPLTTPVGSYPLNVTGTDPSLPPVIKWAIVTLNVTQIPADFTISVSPNSLTINATESKSAIVQVTSIGLFSQNVTLNATGLPPDVTVTFTPPAPKPPSGGVASSVMRIAVGGSAINGTYPLNIVGSNGTATRSTSFTLTIVKKPVAGIPWITLLLVLLMVVLGLGFGLVAFAKSSRWPGVLGRAQRMYVVPSYAQRVRCPHCGRPIPLQAVYCPFCRHRRGSVVVGGIAASGPIYGPAFAGRRATWGFAFAMTSGILILLNSALLLWPSFWGSPYGWSVLFWWLPNVGQPFAMLIGIISGFTVMTGGMMMIMRRGPTGALITFPFAAVSFIIGGGFLVGAIVGIVAGILGIIRR